MRTFVNVSALMALSVSVSAFVPATNNNLFRASTAPSQFKMSSTAVKMNKKSSASIPNPFKALPWNAQKEREREARRLKVESASLHRELGIADDATFEEITEVTQKLIARAESDGDVKKKIKVEVAKDRIMQIKLNERLAGLSELTEDAKAQSRLEEADEDEDEDLFPDNKPKEWRVPRFAEGLIKKPDAAYRNRQIKVFGIMSLICFILPPMAEKVMMSNWLPAAGQLSRRGMTTDIEADYSPYQGRKSKPHQRTAVLLSIFVWIVLKVWTGTMGNIKLIFGPRYVPVVEATLMNIGLGIFTAFTQTYKAK
jgi:hypothetical protein